ncbi:dynamin family protein [Raineyella sp. LH-20]|uniref:dynamin family protein n=1 Tax=Raineyella sp. LH-20 TaxID=3081204 RepID=UPI002955CC02|nr:dynamin family protein [Raineyella sp. LH-20]WOP20080.1 dynamin family protein [Raineyella sp. LH-20]
MKIEEFVDRTVDLATEAHRTDLVDRLARTRRRWADPAVRVLVVGEFKQGKSALVNALVTAPVCAVDAEAATTVPTVVKYGDPPAARLVLADHAPGEVGLAGALGDEPTRSRPVPLDQLAAFASERANPDNTERVAYAEAAIPRTILDGGLELVDTPGVGTLTSGYAGATASALPAADALLFVSDASRELTAPELAFLTTALRSCPNAACIITKTDAHVDWAQIVELDRRHLQRAGLDLPVIAVSSRLRELAIKHSDAELHNESGFPELVRHLREDIVGQARRLTARTVANDVLSVTDNLRAAWQPELSALEDPSRLPEVLSTLEQAQAEAQALRERSARWQVALGDGMADLVSDLEHDVRERLRVVIRDAEAAIDADDPATMWDEFGGWLDERVNSALAESFLWAEESTRWLAQQVAEHFSASAADAMPVAQISDTTGVLERVPSMSELDMHAVHLTQKLLIGMRGSYGGVLMFGLITGMAGMALINPISIGAGVLLGGKAYVEDRQNRLARRRGEAKTIVRRRLDDVQFQVLKVMKDRLRVVQRAMRDHYTEVAGELQRSMAESIASAKAVARQGTAERAQRIADLQRFLATTEQLAQGGRKLMGQPA